MRFTANELALVCASTVANAAKYVQYLNDHMEMAQINTPRRVAMFLAQVSHESQRLSKVEENLSYSAKRLTQVWPSRFPTLAAAAPYAMNPKALANKTYGNRMGNTGPNDGWMYRGRGLKQLTGKNNYAHMTKVMGIDFVNNPDLVALDAYAAGTAVQFWRDAGGNVYADRGDYMGLTKAINGGLVGFEDGNDTGLDDRVELLQYAEAKLALLDQSFIYLA